MELYINIDLSQHIKRETMNNRFRNLAYSILEDHQDHTTFYTDGSKTEAGVGASVYYNNVIKIIKLPDFYSIYTAEALTISHALEIVKQQKIDQALILSDSLSALNSILNIKRFDY